jgi:superoxide dismutase
MAKTRKNSGNTQRELKQTINQQHDSMTESSTGLDRNAQRFTGQGPLQEVWHRCSTTESVSIPERKQMINQQKQTDGENSKELGQHTT